MKRWSFCLTIAALALLALSALPARSEATSVQESDPGFVPPDYSRDPGESLDQGGELCSSATTIIVLPFCDEGTTWWYTDNYTPTCGPSGGRDVVYRYRPMLGQTVTISLCGSYFNTILHVWRGCPDQGGVLLCCNDNTTCAPYGTASCCQNLSLPTLPVGQYYYIIVDGAGPAAAGHYILNVFASSTVCYDAHCTGTPPPNDLCANPTLLPNPGGAQWVTGYTIGAGMDTVPVCNGINAVAPGVWYKIIGNGSTFTVTTCDPLTDYDTQLSVYCGTCANLFCVTANDNFNVPVCGPTSEVQWCTEANREYYVLVHGATPIEVGHFRLGYWSDGTPCSNPPVCTAAPPNDLCVNAQHITTPGPGSGLSVLGTTVGATWDNAPCCLSANTSAGVWYSVVGNGYRLTASTCNVYTSGQNWNTKLSVYCNTCANLSCVDGNDDYSGCVLPGGLSRVSWCSVAGESYYILVHGLGSATGSFSLDLSADNALCGPAPDCLIPSPPPNDHCDDAITLSAPSITPQSIRGSTIGASQDNAPFCVVADAGSGVWYRLTGDGHRVWMTTCNEYTQCLGYDTRLSVYCGDCEALTCVTGNDDLAPCPPMSEVIWCTEPGREYWVLVHGIAGSVNNFQLDWWEEQALCTDYPVCAATGDSCADAIPIHAIPFCDEGTTWWYADNYTPPCASMFGGRDRVYRYRLDYTEQVTVSLCGSYFDTVLHIWMGCPDAGGTIVCCVDNTPCALDGMQSCCPNLTLMGNTDYYIIVDGNGASAGHYILNVAQSSQCPVAHCAGTPPPNDSCIAAILLPSPADTGQWRTGWTIGASLDVTPQCRGLNQVAPGVWYKIVGLGNLMTVTTCDMYTDFDTRLTVFAGRCDSLVCVAANDNFNIPVCGTTSLVRWCANNAETYYVLVHGAFGYEVGHFKIGYWYDDLDCGASPDSVVIQPVELGMTPDVATHVRLYWPPVPGCGGYAVYRDTLVNIGLTPGNRIGLTTDTTFTDSLRAGLRYFYQVTTSNP